MGLLGPPIYLPLLAFVLGWGLGDRWHGWLVFGFVWAFVGWLLAVTSALTGGLFGAAKIVAVAYVGGLFVGFLLVEAGVRVRDRFEQRRKRRRARYAAGISD